MSTKREVGPGMVWYLGELGLKLELGPLFVALAAHDLVRGVERHREMDHSEEAGGIVSRLPQAVLWMAEKVGMCPWHVLSTAVWAKVFGELLDPQEFADGMDAEEGTPFRALLEEVVVELEGFFEAVREPLTEGKEKELMEVVTGEKERLDGLLDELEGLIGKLRVEGGEGPAA